VGPADDDGEPRRAASEDLSDALDGAGGDLTISGDAMRWSPEQAAAPAPPPSSSFPGLDVAAGLGSVLGLDPAQVRRLVSGVVTRMATIAGEAVTELRQRASDAFPGDERR
jgi:serine/threonine-protein kinase RsbW